jgi:hypothetical protein
MQKNLLMRGISFVSVLCVSLALFAATPLQAEELKPFLTVKIASPKTLLDVAEKIAQLAGAKEEFQEAVNPFKGLDGLNAEGPIGVVFQSNGEEIKEPILILPIKDINAVKIPGFEMITASLKKLDDGKFILNSPAGNYVVHQKKDFVFVVSEESEVKIPDSPKALLTGLEDYTLGIKVDFENTTLDAIQALLAIPQMLLAMQGGQQASQVIEQLNETIDKLYEEFNSTTQGISFDPKTADLNYTIICVPKKDSKTEKNIANNKNAQTAFSGFIGKNDAIFSVSSAGKQSAPSDADVEKVMGQLEQVFNAVQSQIEEQSETDEEVEAGEAILESVKKVFVATLKKEQSGAGNDTGISLSADGTFLLAQTIGDTAELENLVKLIFNRLTREHEKEAQAILDKYLKKNTGTIEGYKISSLKVPLKELTTEGDDIPKKLKDETLGFFWGVKENEAVVLGIGLDFDKTETTFKNAVSQTKTLVPIKQPSVFFALQPLGKLLKKYTDQKSNDTVTQVIDRLATSGDDAKVTVSSELNNNTVTVKIFISGKIITSLVNVFKIISSEGGVRLTRPLKE